MQHSLFEPLHSLHALTMENSRLSPACSQAGGPSLFTISPPSPSFPSCIENTPSCFDHRPTCSFHPELDPHCSCPKAWSEQDLTRELTHLSAQSPCSFNSNSSLSQPSPSHYATTACQKSCNTGDDDGSVASKLLSTITKSMSSPSLNLASSKETARETPYQKALKLKQMKLQHCAEELGTESSDISACSYNSIEQSLVDIEGNASGFLPSFRSSTSHKESSLKSVRSLPNFSTALPLMANQSRYTRTTSFPPPLSHTLPTSSNSSSEPLSLSLCAYREDGRFILKETMVSSKHYLHARRTNGRLTLHVVTRDNQTEDESGFDRQDDLTESIYREFQEENGVEVVEDNVIAKKTISLHTMKGANIAGSNLDISLQRTNPVTHHHSHIDNESSGEEDRSSNVVFKVITVSLQTTSHSKVTLHKSQVVSYNPQKSLMKAVSELATSPLPETSYGNGEWCLAGKKYPLLTAVKCGDHDTTAGGYAISDNKSNTTMNGKLFGKDGQFSQSAIFGYNSSYLKVEKQASDGGKKLHIRTSPLNLDLHLSSPFSWEEWLHTLHCKELIDRNHLGHGLSKLPCIPTRS